MIERVFGNVGIALPAHQFHAMFYIALGLVCRERFEVAGRDHALTDLFHFGPGKFFTELGLAEQETLHKRAIVHLKIGQHSELFNRFERHVLDFVDYENDVFSLAAPSCQETFNILKYGRLVPALCRQAKRARHHAQRIVGTELRGHDVGGNKFALINLAEKLSNDCRLARANMAGDDNKTVPLVHAIGQISHRLFVAPARVVKPVVGA